MADYRVGFESCETEYEARELPVEGDLPDWLSGSLVRNGPGTFDAGGESFQHWFDGLAMLRKFSLGGGGVRYTNRFLRTEEYRSVVEDDGLGAGQFGTGPSGSVLERLRGLVVPETTDNANVNVMRSGARFLALTEVPRQVAFDPGTLETLGEWTYDDEVDAHMACAHPVADPESGATYNLSVRFGLRPEYVVTRLPDGATGREVVGTFTLSDPVYVHSFALTPDHVVVAACPLVVDVWGLLRPGGPGTFLDALDWRPERSTRFVVLSRATGDVVATPSAPAFFTFHHANAVRRGDDLLVDLVAFDDAGVLTDLSLERLRSGSITGLDGDLRRYRLPLDGGPAASETVASGGFSLPRFDERRRGRAYRYVYATRAGGDSTSESDGGGGDGERERGDETAAAADVAPNRLARVDCWTGETTEWVEPGGFCGEPVFVPRPGGTADDDGVVLSVVLDPEREQSFLVVLDAETFEERARAWTPHVLPFDFHGQFYADLE